MLITLLQIDINPLIVWINCSQWPVSDAIFLSSARRIEIIVNYAGGIL